MRIAPGEAAEGELRRGEGPAAEAGGRRHELRLTLLGGLGLGLDGRTIPLPLSAQRLLAFLALHERALPRSFVAGSLWPDTSDDRAAGNLRSALWRLGHPGHLAVEASAGLLRLSPIVDVDLRESTALAHTVLEGALPLDRADRVREALSSPLLPGWSEDWLVIERERFEQLRLHALESMCEQLTAAGMFAEAVEAGLTAVGGDPLRESAHRALIRAHLAEGNIAEAVEAYRAFRRLLQQELGLDPSPELQALIASRAASLAGSHARTGAPEPLSTSKARSLAARASA